MIRKVYSRERTVLIACAFAAPASAQQPKSFEAASIKPSAKSDEGRTPNRWKDSANGIDYKYVWISALMQKAYGLKDYQITLPRGYKPQPEFDIVARSPVNSQVEDIPLMLRSLLADRFHLRFHRETKEMSVYELVVAKGDFPLKRSDSPAGGLGGRRTEDGMSRWDGHAQLATLTRVLTDILEMPVIDKTGLEGVFDIDFRYAPLAGSVPGPAISDALQESLGLKLEPRKDPVETLIVDHIDSAPTEN